MRKILTKMAVGAVAAACLAIPAANAEVVTFSGALDGSQEVPAPTTEDATGLGTVTVNTETMEIDFELVVEGLTLDELNDGLVAGPQGPIHLHNAPAGQNGPIIVPFAFNDTDYQASADGEGFTLSVSGFNFADAVAISGSDLSFEDFVAALTAGLIYINVHSDQFAGGAIRGQLSEVPLPGAALLFMSGIAGAAGMRARKKR